MPDVSLPESGCPVLSRFLREHRDRILAAWEAAERRRGLVPCDLDRGAVLNLIPTLLDRIAEGANSPGGREIARSVEPVAEAHFAERLRLGLDFAEVAEEYALLRRAILEELAACEVVLPPPERVALHESLDAAMIRPTARLARDHAKALEAHAAERERLLAEARRALAREEKTRRHRGFLAEASAVLAESLDYEETLRRVVELGGTRFADYCMLDLAEPAGARRLAIRARDPEMDRVLERARSFPVVPGSGSPWAAAYEGEAVLIDHVTPGDLDRIARSPEHREVLERASPRSILAVPVAIRDRVFGVLIVGAVDRVLDREDLAVARELGRRAALAIESARLYREAREAIRAREEFLSIAAHELKTPLTTLHLHLQTLRRGLDAGPVDPGRIEVGLGRAIDQSTRLKRLLDHLLDLSRATAGRLVLEPEEVALSGLVHEVVGRLSEQLAAAGCVAEVRCEGKVTARWDRIRIEQVLTNLLANAIRYAPGAPLEVEAGPEEGGAYLRVRDHGPGISPGARERIFSPFQRATESLAAGGLGLGLFISKQIVEAHGGRIEAESVPGRGAAFTVHLPLDAPVP